MSASVYVCVGRPTGVNSSAVSHRKCRLQSQADTYPDVPKREKGKKIPP